MFTIGKRNQNIIDLVEISCYSLFFLLQTTSFYAKALPMNNAFFHFALSFSFFHLPSPFLSPPSLNPILIYNHTDCSSVNALSPHQHE